jgi:hypothetical protein
MKKFIFENEEKERIKKLYESVGIVLLEDNIFGKIARKALSFAEKNEDDIARLFKTTEVAIAKDIDEVIGAAFKANSISQIEELQARLMHIYNPSGMAENIPAAQQKVKNFLNGYAKSKGRTNFQQMKNEIVGGSGQSGQQARTSQSRPAQSDDWAEVRTKQPGTVNGSSYFSGKRISNRTIESLLTPDSQYKINWADIKNKGYGNTPEEWAAYYNKLIAEAIQTGNYQYISSKGFESVGISNLREYLKNNIERVIEIIPATGRWSVIFKQ